MTDAAIQALEDVIADVVTPSAEQVDHEGVFPSKAVRKLGEVGILGMTVPTEFGGGGAGLSEAAEVVEALSQSCGSTAMVVMMHFAATAVIAKYGPSEVLAQIAAGNHLSTLAFSEVGSRSHFWAPVSTASTAGEDVALTALKSWVTSAGEADSYVWSSRPLASEGPMTLWLMPSATPGLNVAGPFDGLGLRGNASRPIHAESVHIRRTAMLGADGAGLDIAMETALPWFLVLSAAFSVGLAEAAVREAVGHLTRARLEHLQQTLADQPLVRHDIGRMRLLTDSARATCAGAIDALRAERPDATIRLLEVKAVAAEAAIAVTDLAMKACGGAAFRKELALARRFRDARAARVMAPTTDLLIDFVARAECGMPILEAI